MRCLTPFQPTAPFSRKCLVMMNRTSWAVITLRIRLHFISHLPLLQPANLYPVLSRCVIHCRGVVDVALGGRGDRCTGGGGRRSSAHRDSASGLAAPFCHHAATVSPGQIDVPARICTRSRPVCMPLFKRTMLKHKRDNFSETTFMFFLCAGLRVLGIFRVVGSKKRTTQVGIFPIWLVVLRYSTLHCCSVA